MLPRKISFSPYATGTKSYKKRSNPALLLMFQGSICLLGEPLGAGAVPTNALLPYGVLPASGA
jgi:hypothetical protein